jgi:hypothetical protein
MISTACEAERHGLRVQQAASVWGWEEPNYIGRCHANGLVLAVDVKLAE